MQYAIELDADGQTVAGLYRSDVRDPPPGASPVSNEIGETLRHCSNFSAWRLIDGHLVASPPAPLTQQQIDALRHAAYQSEADPIYFKWRRGEATESEWLAKIAEIRARYPDPTL